MSEPTLQDIGDYNTLQGEKKRIVWAVIIAGLIIGGIYVIVGKVYGTVDDAYTPQKTLKEGVHSIPMK